ncbi:YibE/F family protein [Clostridium sp. DSM 100503]|uniref:YibE/F family protein n=1 Tax=Clostridium sp. DSM 100503 TaxID=2963282 RepID=UPI002149A7ED|nr:YibE/F family protein [Clostridium sp. DSM 100503]MCR1950838.1 YibE/F family protein [Clostridium sp. DSM 100503]
MGKKGGKNKKINKRQYFVKAKFNENLTLLLGVIFFSVILIIISKSIFRSGFLPDKYNGQMKYYNAVVTEILSEDLTKDPYIEDVEVGFQKIVVKISSKPYSGNTFEIENPISRLYNLKVKEGTKVIVGVIEKDGSTQMNLYSYDRSNMIYLLISVFILSVVIIGGFKGLKSLVALIFTLICCIYLMVPLMLRGVNPILSGILMSILSITVTLILVSGFNKKTLTAILGTVSGVIIAGLIAYIFGSLTKLSGLNMSEAESLAHIAEDTGLKLKGIMFTGILVATLGAVMDIAMSIASSIFEIHKVNDKISFNELFKSAMNIGKDTIGTMTNTLILAFAGGSLSILILVFSANMPFNKLINLDLLGIEIIQGLSGSIGIVLAVPITAFIGCYLCKNELKFKK